MVYGIWTFAAAIVAFIISAVAGAFLIPMLRKLHFGQTILEDGPKWHKKKQGTPIMGGFMFIIAITVVTIISTIIYLCIGKNFINLYFADINKETVMIFAGLFLALANGAIGFIDDYTKVVKKRNLGLTAKQKLVLQFAAAIAYIIILAVAGCGTETTIPFVGRVDLGFFYYIISAIVIVGIVNAVNLTDGVDGLDGSITFFGNCLYDERTRRYRMVCRIGRRLPRFPCMELPPCKGIYGRHRLAFPRRSCVCNSFRC